MNDKLDEKRSKILARKTKSKKPLFLWIASTIILIVVVVFFFKFKSFDRTSPEVPESFKNPHANHTLLTSTQNGTLSIPLSAFNQKRALFYKYPFDKGMVYFFALKSSDGIIRVALDACDSCYRMKKGYRQDGENMICNNCGQVFSSVNINVITGGCNPIGVNRKIESDYLSISLKELRKGLKFFPAKGIWNQ